jgi:hypothetical protein
MEMGRSTILSYIILCVWVYLFNNTKFVMINYIYTYYIQPYIIILNISILNFICCIYYASRILIPASCPPRCLYLYLASAAMLLLHHQ